MSKSGMLVGRKSTLSGIHRSWMRWPLPSPINSQRTRKNKIRRRRGRGERSRWPLKSSGTFTPAVVTDGRSVEDVALTLMVHMEGKRWWSEGLGMGMCANGAVLMRTIFHNINKKRHRRQLAVAVLIFVRDTKYNGLRERPVPSHIPRLAPTKNS